MQPKFLFTVLITATSLVSAVIPALANPTEFSEYADFYHNARAGNLCNDTYLGHNVQNNSGARQSASSRTRSGGGGIGVNVGIIGVNANGRGANTRTQRNANQWDRNRRTVVSGQDCSVNAATMGNIIMNDQDNHTMRYLGDVEERMNQNDNSTRRHIFDGSMRRDRLYNMFQ